MYAANTLVGGVAKSLASLPERATRAAGEFQRGGEYDPGPALETALMTMGGSAFRPPGSLGAGPKFGMNDTEWKAFVKAADEDIKKAIAKPKTVEQAGAYESEPGVFHPMQPATPPKMTDAEWDTIFKEKTKAPMTEEPSTPWQAKPPQLESGVVQPHELPREVTFGVPERAQQLGFNVPLVHGTRREPYGNWTYPEMYNDFAAGGGLKKDFGQFELPADEIGTHFGSPRAAGHFTGDYPVAGTYPRKFPVVIRAQNPLEMKDLGSWGPQKVLNELERLGFSRKEASQAMYTPGPKTRIENLRDYIQSKGYDSIKYQNTVEDPGHTSYILMDPARARVPWAKFDPTKLADPNLLSGIAGGAVTLDMLRSRREGGQ
jgi:hypothetical protein